MFGFDGIIYSPPPAIAKVSQVGMGLIGC
jgi:hypothetical protein